MFFLPFKMSRKVTFDDSSSEEDKQKDLQSSRLRKHRCKGVPEDDDLHEKARGSHSTKSLFSSSSDDDDEMTDSKKVIVKEKNSSIGFSINKAYAEKYEEVKRAKELHSLSSKYGKHLNEEEEDDSDEEDNDGVLLTKDKELAFAKALFAARHGNKMETESFFPSSEEQVEYNSRIFEEAVRKKHAEKKKTLLADEYQRAVLASSTGELPEDMETVKNTSGSKKLVPRSAKEKVLRDAFLKSAAEVEDFSVLRKGSKTSVNERDEKKEAEEESEARSLIEKALTADGTESTNEEEVFLKHFFVNELWREDQELDGNSIDFQSLVEEEDLEAFYDKAEEWEHKFQEKKYRHEEEMEAASHVSTYARPIGEGAEGLLRKQDTSRKDARHRRRERICEARQRQVEELKRLKHLQKKEIDRQRELIASVAGLIDSRPNKHHEVSSDDNNDSSNWGEAKAKTVKKKNHCKEEKEVENQLNRLKEVWSEKDFDAPFDPVEFDQKMKLLFNDDYYDEENVDEDELEFMEAELDEAYDPLDDLEEGEEECGRSKGNVEGDKIFSRGTDKRKELLEEILEAPDLFFAESLEAAKEKERFSLKPQSSTFDASSLPYSSNNSEVFSSLNSLSLLYPTSALPSFDGNGDRQFCVDQEQPEALMLGDASDINHSSLSEQNMTGKVVIKKLQDELTKKEDAYYRLHQESDSAFPFKYKEVPAEDFGLSIEEILARDDRQLNMIAPLKCYAAYLDKAANERDRRRIENRRRKGFRELESYRRSRRYGQVENTVLLDQNMREEEGKKIAERLRSRLEDEKRFVGKSVNRDQIDKKRSITFQKHSSHSSTGARPKPFSSNAAKRFKNDFVSQKRASK